MIHHYKNTLYHPQANGMVEDFNKILEHDLTKFINVKCDDWDQRIPLVLWSYQTNYKWITKCTPFTLVYSKEALIVIEFIVPGLDIAIDTHMEDEKSLHQRLDEIMELEEDHSVVRFIQVVEKQRQKAWHDHNIHQKNLQQGSLVLLYDRKY
jgi:hypothetical protein